MRAVHRAKRYNSSHWTTSIDVDAARAAHYPGWEIGLGAVAEAGS
jgi:hypothetical protein